VDHLAVIHYADFLERILSFLLEDVPINVMSRGFNVMELFPTFYAKCNWLNSHFQNNLVFKHPVALIYSIYFYTIFRQ
jgi:hypothetical protein